MDRRRLCLARLWLPVLAAAIAALAAVAPVDAQGDPLRVAVVAVGADGLRVVDVSDPTTPRLLGRHPIVAVRVAAEGRDAFVTGAAAAAVDVRIPTRPRVRALYRRGAVISTDLAVADGVMYDAHRRPEGTQWFGWLMLYDARRGGKLPILGSTNTPGDAAALAVSDGMAYLAEDIFLTLVDVRQPANLQPRGSLATFEDLTALDVADGGHVVIADQGAPEAGDSTLITVDVRDPLAPAVVGRLALDSEVRHVAVEGQVAYLATSAGLDAIDISNPAAPTVLGSVTTPGIAGRLRVVDGRAYVADGVAGLTVVDVGDPRAPAVIGRLPLPAEALDVALMPEPYGRPDRVYLPHLWQQR